MIDGTTDTEALELVERASAAAKQWSNLPPTERSTVLENLARTLEANEAELVELAAAETHLHHSRLAQELRRASGQLRAFARQIQCGAHLQATIETARESDGSPDLRRMKIPLGPVAVFAASNFPFAFGVLGGDTASALAAGCPVVVKSHPGHPKLSERTISLALESLTASGAPVGTLSMVRGLSAGLELLRHPVIVAAAFTGSTAGGRALFDIAQSRPNPIPFYGELGSVNPVFVTRAAMMSRGEQISAEFVDSYTRSAGQLCTKPGVLVVPAAPDWAQKTAARVRAVEPHRLLTDSIHEKFVAAGTDLRAEPWLEELVTSRETPEGTTPDLLRAAARDVLSHPELILEERFGPSAIIVEYDNDDELAQISQLFGGVLAATIHAELSDDVRSLVGDLVDRAGRIVWNGWPTGVAVSPAMQHGGPYPSSTAASYTSVGFAAIERFLRPVAFQSFPQDQLPPALRDENEWGIERRIDGRLVLPPRLDVSMEKIH